MIEYKAEIWNSNTHKYDVIKGSNLTGLYAYLVYNTDIMLTLNNQFYDDTVKLLAECIVESDIYHSAELAPCLDELNLRLKSYERSKESLDDKDKQIAAHIMLKLLQLMMPLITPEALDEIFKHFAKKDCTAGFKYQSTDIKQG